MSQGPEFRLVQRNKENLKIINNCFPFFGVGVQVSGHVVTVRDRGGRNEYTNLSRFVSQVSKLSSKAGNCGLFIQTDTSELKWETSNWDTKLCKNYAG